MSNRTYSNQLHVREIYSLISRAFPKNGPRGPRLKKWTNCPVRDVPGRNVPGTEYNNLAKNVKSPSLNKFVFVSIFLFFTIFVVVNMLVKFSLVFTCWLAKAEVLSVLKI